MIVFCFFVHSVVVGFVVVDVDVDDDDDDDDDDVVVVVVVVVVMMLSLLLRSMFVDWCLCCRASSQQKR